MKVYIVMYNDYGSSGEVMGLFLSREAAMKVKEEKEKSYPGCIEIEEHEVKP